MIQKILYVILAVPLVLLVLHTIVRIVRRFYKFPIPAFLVPLIDNPWRHRIQPPDVLMTAFGLEPGMRVLEVGPGSGSYTIAAARRVQPDGEIVALDIQPAVIAALEERLQAKTIPNIATRVGNVYALPDAEATFDAAYMIAVIGEIPDPAQAMQEIHRVLKPGGLLGFSELMMDADFPLPGTLKRYAAEAGGYVPCYQKGNLAMYTLVFRKI